LKKISKDINTIGVIFHAWQGKIVMNAYYFAFFSIVLLKKYNRVQCFFKAYIQYLFPTNILTVGAAAGAKVKAVYLAFSFGRK